MHSKSYMYPPLSFNNYNFFQAVFIFQSNFYTFCVLSKKSLNKDCVAIICVAEYFCHDKTLIFFIKTLVLSFFYFYIEVTLSIAISSIYKASLHPC